MGNCSFKIYLTYIILVLFSILIFSCKDKDTILTGGINKNISSEIKNVTPILSIDAEVLPVGFVLYDAKMLCEKFNVQKLEKQEYEKTPEYIKRVQAIVPDNIIAISADTAEISYNADTELLQVTLSYCYSFHEGGTILVGTTEKYENVGEKYYKHYGFRSIDKLTDDWSVIHTYTFKLNIDTAKMIKNDLKVIFVVKPSVPEKGDFISRMVWDIDDVYPTQHHEYSYFWGKDIQIWVFNRKDGKVINKLII